MVLVAPVTLVVLLALMGPDGHVAPVALVGGASIIWWGGWRRSGQMSREVAVKFANTAFTVISGQ